MRTTMSNPKYLIRSVVALTEAESLRVRRFCVRIGNIERARLRLGIGHQTMDAARDCGRMQVKTRNRLLDALDREEAAA
jgi:hypothetical protein